MHSQVKPLNERNPIIVGAVGAAVLTGLVVASLNYDKMPFISNSDTYSAYFAEAGGILPGNKVRVSGVEVGKVSDVRLDGPKVLIDFTVRNNVRLGDRSEAAIRIETVLGSKMLDLTSRGDSPLHDTIPLDRTTSPYDLPSALGDLTTTISGLDTNQLSSALTTLSETFKDTPPELKNALDGIGRLSGTLNARDAQLRNLLSNAGAVSKVLAERTDQIVQLVSDSNGLLAAILQHRDAIDSLMANLTGLSKQVSGLIADNKTQLRPALDKLNGVLEILDNHKVELQTVLPKFNRYLMQLGETTSSGPGLMAYLANLLPGQFTQPFIDAAFSDLGLDPNVLLPSQLNDPMVGQPGTPPMPMPYPRTGQGGDPHLTLPDTITGNQDPSLPLQSPGRYPYREPLPAPPAGGPPPGPPAGATPGVVSTPQPSAVFVPAPNEVPPPAAIRPTATEPAIPEPAQ